MSLEPQLALDSIKEAIKKTYGKKGEKIVAMNCESVDEALINIHEVQVPSSFSGTIENKETLPADAPDFVKNVTAALMRGEGESLTVSQMPEDGTWPTGTTQFEKRNIAVNIPVWNPETCIQCGQCSIACPHSVIRVKMCKEDALTEAPESFKRYSGKYLFLPSAIHLIQPTISTGKDATRSLSFGSVDRMAT